MGSTSNALSDSGSPAFLAYSFENELRKKGASAHGDVGPRPLEDAAEAPAMLTVATDDGSKYASASPGVNGCVLVPWFARQVRERSVVVRERGHVRS